jgi:hypothetical protein
MLPTLLRRDLASAEQSLISVEPGIQDGHCKNFFPGIDQVASFYLGSLKVAKIGLEPNPANASRYQILGVPALLFFKAGTLMDKSSAECREKRSRDAFARSCDFGGCLTLTIQLRGIFQ